MVWRFGGLVVDGLEVSLAYTTNLSGTHWSVRRPGAALGSSVIGHRAILLLQRKSKSPSESLSWNQQPPHLPHVDMLSWELAKISTGGCFCRSGGRIWGCRRRLAKLVGSTQS